MKFRYRFFAFIFFLNLISAIPVSEIEDVDFDDEAFLAASSKKPTSSKSNSLIGWSLFHCEDGDKYKIDFKDVSILEYLDFIRKISKIDFQFDRNELDFTTTILAQEPTSVENILSSLIQILRSKGFTILEQDNYLLITRSKEINQIPTIVLSDKDKTTSPIVTRIFPIKNGNITAIASIIRSMVSQAAFIDVFNDTRQLIITDIRTNIEKIATLLQSLDSARSPLEIEVYKAKHISVDQLILLAKQIVTPFTESNPLILVPQEEANAVFIVSTPILIERTIEVMEDLDAKPKDIKGPIGDRVYLYKILNRSAENLLEAIQEIAKELSIASSSSKLVAALENVKWIKDSQSLMFVTDQETQGKIEAILKTLDTFSDAQNFYIYKLKEGDQLQVERSLDQLASSLKKSASDQNLIDTIHSLRYIKETNSFIFTGADEALKKLRDLLPTFDVAIEEYSPSNHYWLYTPQFLNGKELESSLEEIKNNLISAGLADPPLLFAFDSMKWVPSTNTLLFTGTPAALEHIQAVLKLIDVATGSFSKIFLYQPKFISNSQIEEALDELADKLDHKNLSERNLANAIDNMTWIKESQTFLFKGDPSSIEKLDMFLKEIDNQNEAKSIAQAYFLFKLKYARGDSVISQLEKIAKNLPQKDPEQIAVTQVIDKAAFLQDTNSILLTGPQKAVDEVKTLISQFDVIGSTPPTYEKTAFFIYKPTHLTPQQLETGLKETAADLKKSGLIDPSLLQSINTLQIVELTNSVVFTGTKESLEKTKEIIQSIDVPNQEVLSDFAGYNFFIYKVRYISISEVLKLLHGFVANLEKEGLNKNTDIIKAIQGVKEIKETNSLLFTGPHVVLEKIAELLKQIDAPKGLQEDLGAAGSYVIYKPLHVLGPELIEMMKDFESNLQQSGIRDLSLYDTINQLKYIDRTGFILISGDQKSVEKVQELLRKFDVPGLSDVTSLTQLETSFLVYKLHYHSGDTIQSTLKTIGKDLSSSDPINGNKLFSAINSIQWIKITNSILATGTPEVLTQLKELIQTIDVPLRQVFIEVLIIRTRITNNQQFGLQWGGKVQYLNRFAGGFSNFPSPSAQGLPANTALAPALAAVNATRFPLATDIPNPGSLPGGFDLGVIGDIILHKGKTFLSLASLVNALESDDDAMIVMNPKLIAQDNQQSTIFVGQNIPFQGSNVTTTQGAGTQTQANIEYRDVGTSLAITPILGGNDIVTLDIANEITAQVVNTTGGAGTNLQGLQTSRTSLNAKVHVPNKKFVALSGMIQDTKTHFRSAIPCLGGLPVIGAIFSENDRLNSRDNLIFFIRPIIIDSVEEFEKITQNQEQLYKDRASKQILKEEMDDAINWIREPYCD